MGAAASGDAECVHALIAAGADARSCDRQGWTPLATALNEDASLGLGADAIVEMLLAASADPNAASDPEPGFGTLTPLALYLMHDNQASAATIASRLLRARADPYRVTPRVLQIAAKNNHRALKAVLAGPSPVADRQALDELGRACDTAALFDR
jgi:ankyrin repeat protein